MDLCYSDTFMDFTGAFANYQFNRYLSRGYESAEYIKLFPLGEGEARRRLQRRHEYNRPEQAFSQYRDFCREAYARESAIRDFFAECMAYIRWCVTDGKQARQQEQEPAKPFNESIVSEITEDLARIVYRNDDQKKISGVMSNLALALQHRTADEPYLQAELVIAKVMADWDVSIDYVGDDHGQRLVDIFCAQSIGNQKSANCAIARGFYQYYQTCTHEANQFAEFKPEKSALPEVNCYFWFVNNPLRTVDLTKEYFEACKVVKVGSKGDFFQEFSASQPLVQFKDLGSGPYRDQRVSLLTALAVGKNFLDRNPSCSMRVAGIDDVGPFGETAVGDWINGMSRIAFAEKVDWTGRKTLRGDARPGLFIDAESLAQCLQDEETLRATVLEKVPDVPAMSPEEERQMYIGMAPKHLREAIVPGEVEQIRQIQKRKRKRVDTGEHGQVPEVPLELEDTKKKPNPKKEADNTIFIYGTLAVGTFLGILFLNR